MRKSAPGATRIPSTEIARAEFSRALAQYGRETIPELHFADDGAVTVRKVMVFPKARMAIGTNGNLALAACLGVAALEHEGVDDFGITAGTLEINTVSGPTQHLHHDRRWLERTFRPRRRLRGRSA